MGVEDATDYDVASDTLPPVEGEDLGLDALLAEGLGARPDVASLGAQARAQEQTLGAVKGGYWPSLGVGAAANDAGPQLNTLASDWTAGVTLTWNLFQGGLTDAQVREGRANLDALHAQVAGIRQQVRVDIEQARLSVRAAKEALSAADEALTNAKEQLRLAEGRYRAGVGSIIELGDAQVALTTAAARRSRTSNQHLPCAAPARAAAGHHNLEDLVNDNALSTILGLGFGRVLVVGVVFAIYGHSAQKRAAAAAASTPEAQAQAALARAVPVSVATAARQDVPTTSRGSGTSPPP